MITPPINIDLPGLDEVVRAELGIVREDVERLESGFRATCSALGDVNRQMAAARAHYQALKRAQDALTTKAATEKRLITARRRVLFEMEQEVR